VSKSLATCSKLLSVPLLSAALTHAVSSASRLLQKRPTSFKRDLLVSKETY
jgi:hypothetical protein